MPIFKIKFTTFANEDVVEERPFVSLASALDYIHYRIVESRRHEYYKGVIVECNNNGNITHFA